VWDAIFEIRNPPESGILLSSDEMEVELLGADGQWTTKPLPQKTTLWLDESIMRTDTRRISIRVSNETRACRLTIRFRPLTARERWRNRLATWGVWRRLPGLSGWVVDRMPNRKRWSESRPEVHLPSVPIQQGAHTSAKDKERGRAAAPRQWTAPGERLGLNRELLAHH
jgi:hypothetical protein